MLELKKAIEIAKPFVGSLRKKTDLRPVLKTALITETHVIATDSHRLIRLAHNNQNQEKTLHHYKKTTEGYTADQYPDSSRLVPDPYNAQHLFQINVAEWKEAHDLQLISAKEHKNRTTYLSNNKIYVNARLTEIDKNGKEIEVPPFNQIHSSYTLDHDTNVEKVAYNCEFMLDMLKAAKKAKQNELTCFYYGPMRPMYFVGEGFEALILPVRTF